MLLRMDCLSFAKALRAAGRTPGEVREAGRERFGDLAAELVISELYTDAAELVGDTVAEAVGEPLDDACGLVGDAIGGLFDW